jgi:hypothetical protein
MTRRQGHQSADMPKTTVRLGVPSSDELPSRGTVGVWIWDGLLSPLDAIAEHISSRGLGRDE